MGNWFIQKHAKYDFHGLCWVSWMTKQLTRVPCGTNFDAVPVPFSLGTGSRFQYALNNWDVRAKDTSFMQVAGQIRVEMLLERTTWFRRSKVNCFAIVPSRVCQVLPEPQTAKKCGIMADQDVGPRLQTSTDKVHQKFLALVVFLFFLGHCLPRENVRAATANKVTEVQHQTNQIDL